MGQQRMNIESTSSNQPKPANPENPQNTPDSHALIAWNATQTGAAEPAVELESDDKINEEQVKDSADRIEELIDSDGIFQWVSADEVLEAKNEFSELDAETADAVFDELDRRGLLDDFLSEVYDASHVGGGISEKDRGELFDDLAGKLDADSLVRLKDELKEVSSPLNQGFDTVNELNDAIIEHTSPEVRNEFVKALAEDSDGAFGSADAVTVARVINSLDDPEQIEDAIEPLNDAQLDSVVTNALAQTTTENSAYPNLYAELSTSISKIDNAELKAEFVDSSAARLELGIADEHLNVDLIKDSEDVDIILDGISDVITSDTNGVFQQLTYDSRFNDAAGQETLANYFEGLLANGDTETIGQIQAELLNGNNISDDSTDRFNRPHNRGDAVGERYENAGQLGTFGGALKVAIENHADSKLERKELAVDIYQAVEVWVPPLESGNKFLHLDEISASNDVDFSEILEVSLRPVDPDTNDELSRPEANDEFDRRFNPNEG